MTTSQYVDWSYDYGNLYDGTTQSDCPLPCKTTSIKAGFISRNQVEDSTAQCPRCQIGCSCSKNLPAVTTGGRYAPVFTTWSIRKSSFINHWNKFKLSSISYSKNILQVVTPGAYFPPVATTGAYFAQNESQKLIFLLFA